MGAAALGIILASVASASGPLVLPAPTVFAPGVISGPANDATPTFSPTSDVLYFSHYGATWSVILESHRAGAGWSKPVVAPFSGPSSDMQPSFSPDGRMLVYASRRRIPGSPGAPAQFAFNLWRVVRTPVGWSVPERLPDSVNISKNMHNPSIAANGDIYFTSPAMMPSSDNSAWRLYRAAYRDGHYDQAQLLAFANDTPFDANEPAISPDQSYLIFGSHGLQPPLGQKHLYVSFRSGDIWGPPILIRYEGDDWTTGGDDAEPQLSPDGTTLYFNSSRSLPIDPERSRAQMLHDVERLDAWDNGNSNVWSVPLRPLIDALRPRPQEHSDAQ
jgi:Tol biopolymer transport system component